MTPAANAVPSTRPPRSRSALGGGSRSRRTCGTSGHATVPDGRRPAHRGKYAGNGPSAKPHSHPQLRQSLLYAVASTDRVTILLERMPGDGAPRVALCFASRQKLCRGADRLGRGELADATGLAEAPRQSGGATRRGVMALELDENQPSGRCGDPSRRESVGAVRAPAAPLARASREEPASTPAPSPSATVEPASVASRPVEQRFTETATFGLGCFWNAEAAFAAHVGPHGVTRVGYFGGVDVRPDGRTLTLRDVRTGRHGHVEAVRVHFDPTAVPFKFLVERFQTGTIPRSRKC